MSLTAEQQFVNDFKLCQVPATLGFNMPQAAAEGMLGVSQADFEAAVKRMAAEAVGILFGRRMTRYFDCLSCQEPGFGVYSKSRVLA